MLNFSLPVHIIAYVICFFFYVLSEMVIRYFRNKYKKEYQSQKSLIHSSEDAEHASLDYFNKLQVLDIVRIVASVILFIVVLSIADVRTFSFLAVTIGAIVITLKDYLVSLISYVYVIANYDIGDDVMLGTVLGEIVRVRPLTTSVAGKDEHGDFDGKLHHIPNSKFITDIVERQEIKNDTYRRVTLQVFYSSELFENTFSVWLENLKKYLDGLLVKRSLKEVGNYKSYAGIKYKLHYDYNEEGQLVISVSFISRIKDYIARKEAIVEYVETTRK